MRVICHVQEHNAVQGPNCETIKNTKVDPLLSWRQLIRRVFHFFKFFLSYYNKSIKVQNIKYDSEIFGSVLNYSQSRGTVG